MGEFISFRIRIAACLAFALVLLAQLWSPEGADSAKLTALEEAAARQARVVADASSPWNADGMAQPFANEQVTAEGIVRAVGQQNPNLSENERQRVGAAVMRYSAKYELDPALVTAVLMVESGSRPWAVSPKGAVGLMQIMPFMFESMGIAGNLTNIETNVEAGCWILGDNIRRLGELDGVSAYFWGSNIRGVGYRNRVFERREKIQDLLGS